MTVIIEDPICRDLVEEAYKNGIKQGLLKAAEMAEEKGLKSINIKYFSEFSCFADELRQMAEEGK